MSTAIERFREAIGASPELQEALRPVVSPVYWPGEVVRIARAHGFEIGEEEARDFFDAVAAGDDDSRALSDFELEMVAGGSCVGPGPAAGASLNAPK